MPPWLGVLVYSPLILGVFTTETAPFIFKFHQHDYKVKLEWGEVARYNKQCWKKFEVTTFKFNRTCTAFNLTYISNWNMGKDLEIIFQAYKFASNEYRQFPLRFEVNACIIIDNNLWGVRRAFACGNFTGCPIFKNRRAHVCNYTPDQSLYPPYIPNGRYKLEFQGLHRDQEVFVVNGFVEVYRPFEDN